MRADRIADSEARRAAQTVFDRPLMLEAGAGTGKTTTLVARALAWCIGPGWKEAAARLDTREPHKTAAEVLHGVVAITFTEAAAAEMAARVAESLAMVVDGRESDIKGLFADILAPADTATRRRRAELLLETFDHLTVSTIHAFCFSLLNDHPLQAGLHPDLRVDADGSELEAVARAAVERRAQEAYKSAEDSPLLVLAAHGFGPGQLLEAVTRWLSIGAPLSLLERDPLDRERVEDYFTGLRTTAEAVHRLVTDRLVSMSPRSVAAKVRTALGETVEILAEMPDSKVELARVVGELRDTWADDLPARLGNWSHNDFTRQERDRLADLGDALAQASATLHRALRHVDRLDPVLLSAAREALLPIIREIEQDLRARGVITFAGLLRESQALLRDSPAVLQRLRQRLKLLLVDEFQDTDPVQSEIVRRLGLAGDPSECPSLFVVGDPKQSIYGWRDADLAAYEAFEALLRERGGDNYTLSVNFRSAQALLDEVERAVSPVMRPEPGLQPPFRALQAAPGTSRPRPFRVDQWREIEYWVSWRPNPADGRLGPGTQEESTRVEARELADDIRKLHDHAGVAWSDIGVLFRKTRAQPTFLEELRRQRVPFAVNRDRNYFQRREVIDAAAWIRAIINPADHLALLTVLRSITVGVPDAALIPLWAQSFPKLVTELRGPSAERLTILRGVVDQAARDVSKDIPGLEKITGWEESLLFALSSLARLRDSYRRDPPDRFVANVRRELLVEASEGARFQGEFRLANLLRFFRQLEAAMESDDADVHSILRALRLGVQQAREAEEAMPRDAVEEAVQIMTIHTAKGLEFRHVYLVQMHSGTGGGAGSLLEAREIAPDDWEYQIFGARTLSYQRAEEKVRRIEAAESVRTLYVALTRASERLVLIGKWPEKPSATDPSAAANHVELLQNRDGLPDSFAELANDPTVHLLGGFHDHEGIRWRFLGATRSVGARRRPEPPANWLPDLDRLKTIARSRDLLRSAALTRMDRQLQSPVTFDTSDRIEAAERDLTAGGAAPSVRSDGERAAALAIGTALHRCLETWDLAKPVEDEAVRQIARLADYFPHTSTEEARREAVGQVERLAESDLLRRLREMADHVIGREIPIVLTPDARNEGLDTIGPVGCFAGTIDLLYRDPESDEMVVVDFKTDRVENEKEIDQRAGVYALQEARYARGVREALDLDRAPRTELWFLWPDCLWRAQEAND